MTAIGSKTSQALGLIFWFVVAVSGVNIDIKSPESVCSAAKYVADGEFNYYEGLKSGGTVGMFSQPYYWWHAGEAWGGLLLYYTFCQSDNDTLKGIVYDGMYHQAGHQYNYIPSNQSMTEGNDDQGVWGLTIMEAAERNFSNPQDHSWLSMSQAIYNTMNSRWDDSSCNGGLRWQIFTWNSGYDYKNTISNGALFHIAARLARYTDNETYVDTAEKVYEWMDEVGFLKNNETKIDLHDGANVEHNCTDLTTHKWSYTYGIVTAGCAYMYNHTNDEKWLDRTKKLVEASKYFFKDNIMQETTCQQTNNCNTDQRTFRSLFSRCLGLTASMAPSTNSTIFEWLQTSANHAAQSCSGGTDHVTCGEDWSHNGWDNKYGLGEQMSALEVMMAVIMHDYPKPYKASSGGTAQSEPESGLDTQDKVNQNKIHVKTKDKAGAGILTAIVLLILLAGSVWMAV